MSPEGKEESEVGLQNRAKTPNVRIKNELVVTLVGHHHVDLALTSSRVVAGEGAEELAVLTE